MLEGLNRMTAQLDAALSDGRTVVAVFETAQEIEQPMRLVINGAQLRYGLSAKTVRKTINAVFTHPDRVQIKRFRVVES